MIEGDDGCESRRATDVARTMIQNDARLVVGHFCSSASMAAAPLYADANVMMITPSATFSDLTDKGFWNVFRLTGRDDAQGELAAKRIKNNGDGAEVVLLTDGQIDTAAVADRFLVNMPNARKISVKTSDVRLPNDTALITATSAYLALQAPDAAVAAKALKSVNAGIVLYGPDALQAETYSTRGEAAANGTRITFLRDFARTSDPRLAGSLPSKDGAVLAAYAAVETFVSAAKATNVNDTRVMSQWLTAGNAVVSIVGSLVFDAKGDLKDQPYVWYRWQDGELRPDLTTN
jgi:branched-chain amino acid transport system substrate-binding protein